jgi:hypothetical protein
MVAQLSDCCLGLHGSRHGLHPRLEDLDRAQSLPWMFRGRIVPWRCLYHRVVVQAV